MSHWRASQDTRDDVTKSVRGAIYFAVPTVVLILIVYTLITGGQQ